jgi:hypothetical protein
MTKKPGALKLQVVAPCHEDWDRMPGGDDIRFCGKCRQNVYNLSELTESQVRELVQGPACVRFFARGDGTVVTKECPSMLESARRRMLAMAAGLVPLAAGFWGSVAWLRQLVHGDQPAFMGLGSPVRRPAMAEPELPPAPPTMGAPPPPSVAPLAPPPERVQGGIRPSRPEKAPKMGKPQPDCSLGRANHCKPNKGARFMGRQAPTLMGDVLLKD